MLSSSLGDCLSSLGPTPAHPPILSQIHEQTRVDRQSQRVYCRYIQCAPATPPRTPCPGGVSKQPLGLPVTLIPPLPGRCSSQKHAGGGFPHRFPSGSGIYSWNRGGERKTVLNFDSPPIKSLRGCGAGEGEGGLRFCKNKLSQELTAWL